MYIYIHIQYVYIYIQYIYIYIHGIYIYTWDYTNQYIGSSQAMTWETQENVGIVGTTL